MRIPALALLALLAAQPALAQFADEQADDTGVLNPSDFSWRAYVDRMDRFPDRIGIVCYNAYLLDKTEDHAAALAFFEECGRRGNAAAMINAAHLYEDGKGAKPNLEAAARWLRRAAESGYAQGQYHYGVALLEGKGVARDPDQGRDWLRRAAAQGNRDAQAVLRSDQGRSGNELSYDMQVDSDRRFKCLYGYAAEKTGDHDAARAIFEDCIARWNDVYSILWLAEMYETGMAMPRDPEKAAALLKRGADAPPGTAYAPLARFHYGTALVEGRGVPRDPAQGRRYLARAAAENVKEAAEYLARLTHP